MRRAIILTFITFVPLLLFLAVLFSSLSRLEQPTAAEQAGRRVWQEQGCMECHTLFGDGGYIAREIRGVYSELGAEQLAAFLEQPPMLMRNFRHPQITGERQTWLLQFLSYIDTIPLGNWPPRPIGSQSVTRGQRP